jgi:NADPH-dependent 2,4-dienoyl-CoA reductase/sulfur reductase-like enzyme
VNTHTDVRVVGASAAGLGVVERLRSQGFGGGIEVIGAETHPPYDRPPLSKQVLSGQWAPKQAELRDRSVVDGFTARWTLGRRAVDLDVDGHSVGLDDGRRVHYGTVVLATGLSSRELPWQRRVRGMHALRTIDDCLALREDLVTARRVVVVGAGVLGCEIAATSRSMGLDVTLVDPAPTPMHAQLGSELGAAVARLHAEHGTNATQQAVTVADNILGADRAYTPTSYYWTDQFEVKIQVSGEFPADASIHLTDGGLGRPRFSALVERSGHVVGAVGWKHPRGFREAAGRIGQVLAPSPL